MADMSDQVVIVTGASQGIGEATARRFAAGGARVVLSDVTASVNDAAKAIAETFPASAAVGVVTDVTSADACDALIATAISQFGRLDVLAIATATFQQRTPVATTSPDDWDRIMTVNAKGPFLLCRSAVPNLTKPGGAIVIVSSITGQVGMAENAAYSASKGAVGAFVKSLALELASENIRVNAVSPAAVDSLIARQAMQHAAQTTGKTVEEIRAAHFAQIPFRREADPAEVAEAMYFLASPAASYVTGTCLDVNGGALLR